MVGRYFATPLPNLIWRRMRNGSYSTDGPSETGATKWESKRGFWNACTPTRTYGSTWSTSTKRRASSRLRKWWLPLITISTWIVWRSTRVSFSKCFRKSTRQNRASMQRASTQICTQSTTTSSIISRSARSSWHKPRTTSSSGSWWNQSIWMQEG